ncbi:site-specific integrase [Clostridium sp. BNL1100]|uniref:tyrosine-type recombinase/integrase n=1 Tax=Clostridium sp. BNL1100 TaxID=755731 RepID=UPI00024A7C9B|nr:site-specific integrase [Clostridium sp. BNL1100]AEY65754.1 site-specific recombinase XerD [Clostridium sp. BNL1100]
MKFIETDGLKNTIVRLKGGVPIYLTDDYEVIEGPTYWAMAIAQTRSRSIETLKQYTSILARYLQWRDNEGYKAENWQYVDEDIINEYIGYLKENRDEKGRPNDSAIKFYIARLQAFYKWASENSYTHYWKMDMDKVSITIKNRLMVNKNIEIDALCFQIQNGKPTHVDSYRDKFIHREHIPQILCLFDDVVYAIIALIIWRTALRPKELFQLPYRGIGLNSGLRRYQDYVLETLSPILFEFESKGKRRSINFPPDLWAFICRIWMPKRVERATLFREKHGVMPPNSALFISKNGIIVTRKMLRDNFLKVTEIDECPEKKITPYMLRHSFATYFVFNALKQCDLLGKAYAYNAIIDQSLREWMGHTDIDTTYKYYVHLVNRYFYNDLLEDLNKDENKAHFKIIESL